MGFALDAKEFLEMTEAAFHSGALTDQNSLCAAIGGANHVLCNLPLDKWLQALAKASVDWFDQWPDSSYLEIHADTFFLGQKSKPADINAVYTVFRLFYLSKLSPDSSSPGDLEEENLKIMVKDNLSRRELVFVTDWARLNHIDCCVVEAVEMLGLGDNVLAAGEKRVTVSLEVKGALYRPTWIDAGFWVYWMPNLIPDDDSGFARHLVTGGRGAKEWVCRAKDVQIKAAKVIRASRAVDYRRNQLPETYWNGARQWVVDGRAQL
jgi:hypothetical protein